MRRKSVPRLFADATGLLEQLHGLAVEGQARDQPPDVCRALIRDVRAGIVRLDRIISAITVGLDEAQR